MPEKQSMNLILYLALLVATGTVASPSQPYHGIKSLELRSRRLTLDPSGRPEPNNSKDDPCLLDRTSMDCMIHIAIERAPSICKDNPKATDCILNYFGVFCGDLLDIKRAAGVTITDAGKNTALQACVRSVSFGPCVANQDGAACKSNLFAGIKFPVPHDGGTGSVMKREDKLRSKEEMLAAARDLFPEDKGWNHFVENIVIGIVKWVINDALSLLHWLFKPMAEGLLEWCMAVADMVADDWAYKKCGVMWNGVDAPTYQIPYDNYVQRKGRVAALVVTAFIGVVDAVIAVRFLAPAAWLTIKGIFAMSAAAEVVAEEGAIDGAKLLEGFLAVGEGTGKDAVQVQIWLMDANGDIVTYATEKEAQAALDDAFQDGFRDCMELPWWKRRRSLDKKSLERQVKRTGIPGCAGRFVPDCLRRPMGLRVACARRPHGLPYEDDLAGEQATTREGVSEAPEGVTGGLHGIEMEALPELAPGIEADSFDALVANQMHQSTLKFIMENSPIEPTWGSELEGWAYREEAADSDVAANTDVNVRHIMDEFVASTGLTEDEVKAIQMYRADGLLDDRAALISAFEKLPDYHGITSWETTQQRTILDTIMHGRPGRHGTPGIYDVGDFEANYRSYRAHGYDDLPCFIMSTEPGFDTVSVATEFGPVKPRYFIIRSRKGKWVTPVTRGTNPEVEEFVSESYNQVNFIDRESGSFKLLGWSSTQKVNGIDYPLFFYFDNIHPVEAAAAVP